MSRITAVGENHRVIYDNESHDVTISRRSAIYNDVLSVRDGRVYLQGARTGDEQEIQGITANDIYALAVVTGGDQYLSIPENRQLDALIERAQNELLAQREPARF